MSNGFKPAEAEQPRLGKASTLTRFALIGVALAAVVGTFAYFGGWFTPNDLTPARFTDAFEYVDGATPASVAIMPRGWAFPGSLKAMGTASGSRKRSFSNRGACPLLAASPCRADNLMRPTRRRLCAAWRFSFPYP